jgi:ATP-dependent exoDNAse (exonuclease V) alpha subunit
MPTKAIPWVETRTMLELAESQKRALRIEFGIVSRIDLREGELAVDFEGREVVYGVGKLDELVLVYATTIHKTPGSGYPAVVEAGRVV